MSEFDSSPDFGLNTAKDMIKCAKAVSHAGDGNTENLLLSLVRDQGDVAGYTL